MKYHKIRNVAKEVCTCEQMIAYNLASSCHDAIKRKGFATVPDASRWLMKIYRNGYDYKPGKYDEDAIFCALNAGLEAYCKRPFVAFNYYQVGEAFPAHYLNA
jgi:hypothetical protein